MLVQSGKGPGLVRPPVKEPVVAGRLTLSDGTTGHIRIATSKDREDVRFFFEHLSPESRRRRFFSAFLPRPELIASLCDTTDPHATLTLVVLRTHQGKARIIATASYIAKDEQTAEVAFAVEDAFQHQGLGTFLLHRLASLAVTHGFTRFWAVTQADNQTMRDVFAESGFPLEGRALGSELEVYLTLVPCPAAKLLTCDGNA